MKRFICCLKGESSSNAVQNPTEQPQEYAGESSSNAAQNPTQQPYADSLATLFPSFPPLPANCAESFPWEEILSASLNFLQTRLLGRGNYGEVYLCYFPRIEKAGVAKIQRGTSSESHLEFIAEITMLHEADHPNVIKLLGKCYEPNHRAIVYELMPNGSLDHYLHETPRAVPGLLQQTRFLDWEKRMKIAVGVAKGLAYVHMRLKAVHRDIKAANILLDQHFEPRLTDFGLVTRFVEGENGIEQEGMVTVIKGTPGHFAPEIQRLGRFSTKSDVYSYGVLLLQLFTGKKAFDSERPDATRNLAQWFLSTEDNTAMSVDVALRNKYSVKGFKKVLRTARMCVRDDRRLRPSMDVVETMVVEASAYPITEAPTASSST